MSAVLGVACALLLLAGCGGGSDGGAARSRAPQQARVVHVIDGDTLVVEVDGRERRVRVLGIDTPEQGDCFFRRATEEARRLADDRGVTLVSDPGQAAEDRFGRILAYVELRGGTDLGEAMLRGGYARTFVVGQPFGRVEAYRDAERAARGRGLWAACPA